MNRMTTNGPIRWWAGAVLAAVLCAGVGCGDGAGRPDAGPGDDADVPPIDAAVTCNADDPFSWPVPTESVPITPSPSWKNQLAGVEDPFLSPPAGDAPRWVKFAVLLRDPSRVYFQDSAAYGFHYDFATERLDPLVGMSRVEFDQVSLHRQGQEVALGAVLFPPRTDRAEIAIQLVRTEPYHPEMARRLIEAVAASVTTAPGTTVLYFPTFEQSESAGACRDWFAEHGIVVDSSDRWATADSCYSAGWALGRLVQVPGGGIAAAYAAGSLRPDDILLTDRVPAEVPFVAGIIATEASTPNSHVAILARSYQIPFAHLVSDQEAARVAGLVGGDVVLRADATWEGCSVRVIEVDPPLSPADRAAILALEQPPALDLQAMAPFGAISRSVTGLTASDVKYFGGKAANFGLLRAAIPQASPDAIAFSFDLWRDFLGQELEASKTLEQEIASRLAGFSYPPDMAAVGVALAEIRGLILGQAAFTEAQQQAIFAALSGFAPAVRLRFRSSTNVEDTDHFIGAGLYESHTGCLADDLDDDDQGPSGCDPDRPTERGVLLAMRKVYASFYADNAYLERLRHGVDESQVGMALLVHPSFPDDIELANGVATGGHTQYSSSFDLVTQLGAVSVSNPVGGAIPEQVSVYAGIGIYPTLVTGSSLVPLGATVLTWPDEYQGLTELLLAVDGEFAARNPGLDRFVLDYEYKKVTPDGLVVKQVRRLPQPDPDATWPVYLINQPHRFCVLQGETSDVFADYRVKSEWQIATEQRWLDAAGLQSDFYADIGLSYLDGDQVAQLSGDPTGWTGAGHGYDGDRVTDSFVLGSGADRRDVTVTVPVASEVPVTQCPLRTLSDHYLQVTVDYATPVPTIDWTGVTTTSQDIVMLGECPDQHEVSSVNQRVEEVISAGGITVTTAYYFPEPPSDIGAGYTAPLYKWDHTTITGLTSQPIVLTGYYSQTYRPGHHNFSSDYLFDPWLEPGIDAGTLAELESADVQAVVVLNSAELWTLSRDGVLQQIE